MVSEREREKVNRYGLGPTPLTCSIHSHCWGFQLRALPSWRAQFAVQLGSVDSMERWRNKVAVVSGASAGIGAACARALVGAGLLVVGLARRQERIEQLRAQLPLPQQQRLHAVQCDITCESQVLQAFDWTKRQLGGVHVLVSNAGIMATTELSGAGNTQPIRDTIETNIMGSVYCIREAFQAMRSQQQQKQPGHVIIVNSVAGQQVPNLGTQLPSLNIYPASKFALRAMQEIYRQEFQRHKTQVRVSVSVNLARALRRLTNRK